jgi:hypothetical protein
MKLFLAGAGALAAASPVAAQSPPPPVVTLTAPDPAALDAARDLLRSVNFEGQMEQTAQQAARATFDTIIAAEEARQGESMPADLKAAVQAVIAAQTSELIVEVKKTGLEDAARIYARYFSADELRELQRLQTNPVMKKAQSVGPTLLIELSQIGVRAAAARQPRVKAALDRVVADWAAKQRPAPRS